MLHSLKENMFNPLRNVTMNLFGNGGYEIVSGVDDEEFGKLDTDNYGITSGFQPRKKSTSIRNILVLIFTFLIAVFIVVFLINGLSKTENSHLDALNSESLSNNDVTAEELSSLIQKTREEVAHQDVASEIKTELDTVIVDDKKAELKQLQIEQKRVERELEELINQEKEEANNSKMAQIKDLQSGLEEELKQKNNLVKEQIKKVENQVNEVKV